SGSFSASVLSQDTAHSDAWEPARSTASVSPLYLVVDPRSPLIPGFAMATIPFAAAFVPSGWIRKSAMMMPTTPRPRRPRNDVGRMSGLTELRLHERVVG